MIQKNTTRKRKPIQILGEQLPSMRTVLGGVIGGITGMGERMAEIFSDGSMNLDFSKDY